jgi:hypothetical protein
MHGIDSILQVYETNLLDNSTGISAQFLVLPMDCFGSPIDSKAVLQVMGGADVEFGVELEPAMLPGAIQLCLRLPGTDFFERANQTNSKPGKIEILNGLLREIAETPLSGENISVWEFAYYLTYAPVVPFRRSPLEEQSLAKLVAGAGSGAGAMLGIAAATHNPLVLIWVPAGMIIFAAAKGASRAIEEKVYQSIARTAADAKSRNSKTAKQQGSAKKRTRSHEGEESE